MTSGIIIIIIIICIEWQSPPDSLDTFSLTLYIAIFKGDSLYIAIFKGDLKPKK